MWHKVIHCITTTYCGRLLWKLASSGCKKPAEFLVGMYENAETVRGGQGANHASLSYTLHNPKSFGQ
jgi:hypothetical protein